MMVARGEREVLTRTDFHTPKRKLYGLAQDGIGLSMPEISTGHHTSNSPLADR